MSSCYPYKKRSYAKKKSYSSYKKKSNYGSKPSFYKMGMKSSDNTTTVNRSIGPIAPRYLTKLKYSDAIVVTAASNVTAVYNFNINSLFKPDNVNTGHQPYGFDQLVSLGYSEYRVYRCDWQITIGASANDLTCCLLPSVGTVNSTANMSDVLELPRAELKTFIIAGSPVVYKGSIYLPKLNGQTSTEFIADDGNFAAVTASPTVKNLLNIFTRDFGGTAITQTIAVILTYHCEFFNPVIVVQS